MLSRTARRQEGAQRREAVAEPGLAEREPPPVREARSVPASSAETAEEEAEDDQKDPEPEAPDDEDDDPDDDQDCAYAHYLSPLLEIAPQGLFAFDCFEQCLEIAFSKPARAVALDHLEEERRPVLRGLREDL